jgi:mRNA interferase MazF
MDKFKEWLKRNELALKCKPRTQRASYIEFFEGEFKGEKIPEFKRGEIYFAKLTDSAKTRPFLIYQNNFLNEACYKEIYHTVVVLPLSGQILGGDYRILIKKRDQMSKDSEIVTTAIGIISTGKIIFSKGLVTTLTETEMKKVDEAVMKVLGVKSGITDNSIGGSDA